jgi:23S rRNA pseudouridine1911/1915/1917 synthase
LVGDRTYGGRPRPGKGASPRAAEAIRAFPRQALHAIALALVHPLTGQAMRWEVPMAPDLADLLAVLREEEGGRALD